MMQRNRYKPIVISSYVVRVTNGQVLTSFTAPTAGIYIIGMQLSSNPLGLDVSQTQELWFATNATYREELGTGVALVRSSLPACPIHTMKASVCSLTFLSLSLSLSLS